MREQGIRGNEHLHGKAKLKKRKQQEREQGIKGNKHLLGKERLKKGIAGEGTGNKRE